MARPLNTATGIAAGFDDAVHQSQRVFRAILQAMSQPGRAVTIADRPSGVPQGLSPSAAAVALTLFDLETGVWLDQGALGARDFLVFHCGCRVTADPGAADFAVISDVDALTDLALFRIGTDDYPERGATLLIEVPALSEGIGVALRGPGIDGVRRLSVSGMSDAVWSAIRDNLTLFPRGVDLLLTCGQQVVALPRSVRFED